MTYDPADWFEDDPELDHVILNGRIHRRDGSSEAVAWPTHSTPPGWRVTVRCAADVHPSESRPIVMIAECVGDGHSGPPWRFELRGRSVRATLDRPLGDASARAVPPEGWLLDGEPPARVAYRLRCAACPQDVPIGEEFELYDRMNERAAHRKRSDTLQAIRASRASAQHRMS